MWGVCVSVDYYSAIKRNEIIPFAATWMDLEGIVLNEIRHTGNILYEIIYMWNLKNTTNYIYKTQKRQTHRYREQTHGYQWGKGRGEG